MVSKYFRNLSGNANVYNISQTVKDSKKSTESHPNDFESAISATEFGKFNILLFLVSIPAGWSGVFETTTMSYVFPVAQCDLNLSLADKGLLNAITFLGMVSTGFIWGFLCDTLGRKKLIVVGLYLDAIFVIVSSLSQNFTVLVVAKFFGGFIINGPFAALTSYLSEFHCAKYRSRVQLIRGCIVSFGNLCLPLLAMAILPQDIHLTLFNNKLVLHSWNIFLLIAALPSLTGAIIFTFMPESPKFLMTTGRNKEALNIFKMVYSWNTGNSRDSYPINELVDETKSYQNGHITAGRNKTLALKEGIHQLRPLRHSPYLKYITLICLIQSVFMLTVNSLRLWIPQIFQVISDYSYSNNGTTDLCTMLETLRPSKSNITECFVNVDPMIYFNNVIISVVTMCGFAIAGTLINKLGKKLMLGVLSVSNGLCGLLIYFAQNTATVLSLSAIFNALGGICGNVILTVVIDLFPTTLRTITISIVMMMGRSASMLGNLLFPILLSWGCAPPFFSMGSILIVNSLLIVFLPNTDMKALE